MLAWGDTLFGGRKHSRHRPDRERVHLSAPPHDPRRDLALSTYRGDCFNGNGSCVNCMVLHTIEPLNQGCKRALQTRRPPPPRRLAHGRGHGQTHRQIQARTDAHRNRDMDRLTDTHEQTQAYCHVSPGSSGRGFPTPLSSRRALGRVRGPSGKAWSHGLGR